jgi:hypothetical protein
LENELKNFLEQLKQEKLTIKEKEEVLKSFKKELDVYFGMKQYIAIYIAGIVTGMLIAYRFF